MATQYDVELKRDFDLPGGIAANKFTKNLTVNPLSTDSQTVSLTATNGIIITVPASNVLGIVRYTV